MQLNKQKLYLKASISTTPGGVQQLVLNCERHLLAWNSVLIAAEDVEHLQWWR